MCTLQRLPSPRSLILTTTTTLPAARLMVPCVARVAAAASPRSMRTAATLLVVDAAPGLLHLCWPWFQIPLPLLRLLLLAAPPLVMGRRLKGLLLAGGGRVLLALLLGLPARARPLPVAAAAALSVLILLGSTFSILAAPGTAIEAARWQAISRLRATVISRLPLHFQDLCCLRSRTAAAAAAAAGPRPAGHGLLLNPLGAACGREARGHLYQAWRGRAIRWHDEGRACAVDGLRARLLLAATQLPL